LSYRSQLLGSFFPALKYVRFLFFWWGWGLNSGLYAYKAGALPVQVCLVSTAVSSNLLIFPAVVSNLLPVSTLPARVNVHLRYLHSHL
jgi:hypothetical protein